MDWQPESILGIIFGAGFVLLNKPLGEVSRRWSRLTAKGAGGRGAWPYRAAFVLLGLLLIALGVFGR